MLYMLCLLCPVMSSYFQFYEFHLWIASNIWSCLQQKNRQPPNLGVKILSRSSYPYHWPYTLQNLQMFG
jgi:hypothetical protein